MHALGGRGVDEGDHGGGFCKDRREHGRDLRARHRILIRLPTLAQARPAPPPQCHLTRESHGQVGRAAARAHTARSLLAVRSIAARADLCSRSNSTAAAPTPPDSPQAYE
jgi:hypothetical protein